MYSTATLEMTSPATSSRHLSKFEKMTGNAASDGFGSNFIGAAFYLAQPLGGLLVKLINIKIFECVNIKLNFLIT